MQTHRRAGVAAHQSQRRKRLGAQPLQVEHVAVIAPVVFQLVVVVVVVKMEAGEESNHLNGLVLSAST